MNARRRQGFVLRLALVNRQRTPMRGRSPKFITVPMPAAYSDGLAKPVRATALLKAGYKNTTHLVFFQFIERINPVTLFRSSFLRKGSINEINRTLRTAVAGLFALVPLTAMAQSDYMPSGQGFDNRWYAAPFASYTWADGERATAAGYPYRRPLSRRHVCV